MDKGNLAIEGIKLLKEWSAWMVTAELAVISFLGSSYFKTGTAPPSWVGYSGASFGVSIAAATWVLGALPWIVLNLDRPEFENFFQAPLSSTPVLNRVRVWEMGMVQHFFFVAGIVIVVMGLLGVFK